MTTRIAKIVDRHIDGDGEHRIYVKLEDTGEYDHFYVTAAQYYEQFAVGDRIRITDPGIFSDNVYEKIT